MAASVEREVFSSTRFIISSLTAPMICEEMITETIKTAVPSSRERFLLSRTKPVRARVMLVISRPSRIGSRVSTTRKT